MMGMTGQMFLVMNAPSSTVDVDDTGVVLLGDFLDDGKGGELAQAALGHEVPKL